ncbi:unnamed protein product [Lymnaea stagnalis]|uniref:Nucleoporin Nup188 N-terminal subdomain III domain-containing protein n=1 Tax=Lymnaea stagnalis TaxID=6523 RepID=A0AAV2GZD0_LYMST
MAGTKIESFSSRQLWQTISGTGYVSLRPQEYVERELIKCRDKLMEGISFYKKPSSTPGESLKKEKHLKKVQQDFIIKLSQFLGLDEVQSYDLFCAYLLTEFRGSQKEINHILGHDRHSQTLILKIQDFYHGERLYLLRCLREIMQSWFTGEHPYKDVFTKFAKDMLGQNLLGKKILNQFVEVCNASLPNKDTNGPLMNRMQIMSWALQNLKEQVELLELLLIYYKDIEMDFDTFVELCSKFRNDSFGYSQSFKHLLDAQMDKLVKRIGYLQVLILLEGLDVLIAFELKKKETLTDHFILGNSSNIEKVDAIFSQLRSDPAHGPLNLAWSVLQYILGEASQTEETGGETVSSAKAFARARGYGNVALQLGVFEFLMELLEYESFSGKSDMAATAHYIIYSVISTLLALFHEESLGNTEPLYRIVSKLLSWNFIANTFWEQGESEGLAILYKSAKSWFPVDFSCFIQLNISLASASNYSAKKVKAGLLSLNRYTELLDNSNAQDLQFSGESGVFVLQRKKYPYQNSDFYINAGCRGYETNTAATRPHFVGHKIICWDTSFNAWHMLMGEIHELLAQVSHGAGMVQTEQLLKVTMVTKLVKEVMTSDPTSVPEFSEITRLCHQLILRFAVLSPAPLELLAYSIQCLCLSVPGFYPEVSHHLKQTGLLPFLSKNIDDYSEVLSGDGVNQGLYGCVLAGTECAQGIYCVTLAVLDLVTQLVRCSSKRGGEDEHMASVLFILREVFPRFHKWRYVDIDQCKSIGQKCLHLFHTIFNFLNLQERQLPDKAGANSSCPKLQEVCVYSLLFTDAGRALLEIVSTGVDNVQLTLAQQASLLKGAGVDLVDLIEISLSLLNRLLLLKPPNVGPSPVEQALSSQPPGRQHQHLVAIIAQYIYHRHSNKLPTLATLLLKRLAMVSPMSILACLGNDSEPIRDMFLTRLQAVSEDIQLKVSILDFLSVCVATQPGLIEIFLNVQQHGDKIADATKRDLSLGRSSCLPILLDLMEVKKQRTYQCPPELLCACLDLVHSLWKGMRETPMTVLRAKESFWQSVLAPLLVDLPQVQDQDDQLSLQAMKLQTKLCASSLRIVALEIYAMSTTRLDSNFKKALKSTFSNGRLIYWSNAVRQSLVQAGQASKDIQPTSEQTVSDLPALNLLLAWKHFLVTSSHFKVADIQPTLNHKNEILYDLQFGIQAQFKTDELTPMKMKLASIASGLYFTMVKYVFECDIAQFELPGPGETVQNLIKAIQEAGNGNRILPSVHIGLLGAVTTIIQQHSHRIDKTLLFCCGVGAGFLLALLPVVCSVFLQSSWQVPLLLEALFKPRHEAGESSGPQQSDTFGSHIKLQIVCCCLMVEILYISSDMNSSLAIMKEHSIVTCILTTMEVLFKARQGISYIYTCLLLLIKLANTEMGSSMLAHSDLTAHLCLVLGSCYASEDPSQPRSTVSKAFSSLRPTSVTWHTLYCLSLDLFSIMLRVLGFSFLDDALNVVGVHQDRMQQALQMARVNLSKTVLQEAEATLGFLLQLCAYQKQWRFHLPDVLAKLVGSLMSMVQTHMALMIRPRYLQHILEHHKVQDGVSTSETILQPPSYLQHQSSLDDVEQPSARLVETQHRYTEQLSMRDMSDRSEQLSMRDMSDRLVQLSMRDMSDRLGIDVTEWEPILSLGFGTPSLDDQGDGITFGTLLNCVTICVRHISRAEGKSSPHRSSPDDSNKAQIPRPIVQLALELSLDILMSQACRYLRDPSLIPRDRQFLKRELGTELNSCLSPLHRQLKRGAGDRSLSLTPPHHTQPSAPASLTVVSTATTSGAGLTASSLSALTPVGTPGTPQSGSRLTPQLSRSASLTSVGSQEPTYFKLVQAFVQKVLK